jgi:DNA-binding NarL/FixJ family response regulator
MVDAKTVLLIDGHDADRHYYAHRLAVSSPDYEIFEAADGKTGLKIYQSCSIDCVVLELDLPDMSGFEILLKVVPIAHRPETAVIVLTGLPNAVLLGLALKNGALAALFKNRTPGDVLDKKILQAVSAVTKDHKRSRHAGYNSNRPAGHIRQPYTEPWRTDR